MNRNLKLEQEIYPQIFSKELKSVKNSEFDPLMTNLITDETRYNLIWNIEKNKKIHNNDYKTNLASLKYLDNKNTFNLKEINHKWLKLAQNPDINPEDIFKDFNQRF